MHLSKMRGRRLLVTVLILAILAGGMMLPVSVAAAATGSPTVSPASTVPDPFGTDTSKATTVATTKAPTTKATTAPTTKATVAPTSKATTAPTTAKTSAPVTTVSKATTPKTTAPTTAPATRATTAPTYQAASLPAAVTVVSAPTIVAGTFTVPAGTGKFTITSVGNVPVGGDGVVQLIVDNGWQPLFGDTYIDIGWDPTLVAYKGAAIKVLNTTAAVSSDHTVRIMLGDFRRGYPQGKYPLAAITLRALKEGTSPLTVSVDHVRYWNDDFTEFTDITATASGQAGVFSTGPLPAETQPLVTFTQNTLAPSYYPTNDIDQGSAATAATTYPTATTPTPPAADITIETVATPPPLIELVTETAPATAAPDANGSYAPVSTRIRTSGFPMGSVIVVSLAILGGVALLVRRRG